MAEAFVQTIGVLPFCACFIEEVDVQKSVGPLLAWFHGEYDVLDSEAIYVAVAGHRGECRLQPDLLASVGATGSSSRRQTDEIHL